MPVDAPTSAYLPADIRQAFEPTVTYLNTASYGLMPTTVADAVVAAERQRMAGTFDLPAVDDTITTCRRRLGELIGVDAAQVAIGSQVSQLIGVVANSLPVGATVVVPEVDFTSVLWPFLARQDDLRVRTVPLAKLPEAITEGVDVVATSVVQSADGAVLDVPAVIGAARSCGARVLFDVTQTTGWFPLEDNGADWVVGGTYKWLLGPRGAAFLACRDDAAAELRPTAAGWYAGYNPWETCYGAPLRLADDARRFDLAPVWPAWLGLEEALELILSVGVDAIHRHDVALANHLRTGLGLPESNSAIVAVHVAPEKVDQLRAAQVVGSMRNGRLRLSCHLYNTAADIDRVLEVLA